MLSMLGSMSGLVSGIGTGFTIAGEMATKAFTAVADFFNEYIFEPISNFFSWCGEKWGEFKEWGSDAWSAIATFFTDYILTPLGEFWDWYKQQWVTFGQWGKDAWGTIADFFSEYISKPIGGFFEDISLLIEIMKTNFSTGISIIGDAWSEYISEPIDDFFADISLLINIMEANFNRGISRIGDAWDEYIGEPIGTFFGWIEDSWNYVTDKIEKGWENLTSIFDFSWKDLLPDWSWSDIIPGSLSDFFSLDNLSNVFDSLASTFDAVVEPIKDAINDFIIDTINDVTGYELPVIGESLRSMTGVDKIPHLAKGGIINKPTIAMIGEDGPEAVVPLSQRNNPGGVGMGGGTYNITVNAGGITDRTDKRSLAREIGNMIQQEMARNIGGSTMRGRY